MAREFKIYLSGGASNSDPDLSLGGVESSVETGVQSVAYDASSMAGVTLVASGGNKTDSNGTLTFDFAATTLKYDPPGFTSGTQNVVDVSADGTYVLYAEDSTDLTAVGSIEVTVVSASLPVANDTKDVISTDTANNIYDDVSSDQSKSGHTDYRCIYVDNADAATKTLNLWIDRQPSPDSIKIGFDLAGAGGTATTIATEVNVPSGVVFSTPTEGSPLSQSLTTGQSIAVWVERITPALNLTSNLSDKFLLGMKA